MNSSVTAISTTLAEVDALPVKRLKVELEYGSTGYDREQSFVIKGLLPEQSFVSMYGPSGSFKSFLALDWACHIASGIDWDQHKVIQGAVLYVAGEGGWTYRQWPDGTIKIIGAPSGHSPGGLFAPDSPTNVAITNEIGEYPASSGTAGTIIPVLIGVGIVSIGALLLKKGLTS